MTNGNSTPIDWQKPVQTRDGRKVRILCTDGPNLSFPVIGIVDGDVFILSWDSSGNFGKEDSRSLINVPEPKRRIQRTVYVNLYPGLELGYVSFSRECADECADKQDRIACVKIEIDCEEGEGLS